MHKQTILLIGEVFIDTHLDIIHEGGPLVRLGGIFHAARACAALGIDFALAYYAPNYLNNDINYWSLFLGTKGCYQLGKIIDAPNVMLIGESSESGSQGYINILKDQTKYIDVSSLDDIVKAVSPTDILFFPGRFDTIKVMDTLQPFTGQVHIDAHYDSDNLFCSVNREISTLFLSTSSLLFTEKCGSTFSGFLDFCDGYDVKQCILKENRGGAVCHCAGKEACFESDSYHVPTMHSVGVGDVYDVAFISQVLDIDLAKRMQLAAFCAAKYAETMDYDKFKDNVQLICSHIDELSRLKGIRLPWDKRKSINIYLAAPDFPDIDTTLLDSLDNNLKYHNFSPRRPIKENGLASPDLDYAKETAMYQKDIELLNKCSLLIAVLLNNDPGTLVELGMFSQSGKPTIIFDPFHYCANMFLRHTPNYICDTLSDVIDATYLCLGERKHEEL